MVNWGDFLVFVISVFPGSGVCGKCSDDCVAALLLGHQFLNPARCEINAARLQCEERNDPADRDGPKSTCGSER